MRRAGMDGAEDQNAIGIDDISEHSSDDIDSSDDEATPLQK